MRMIMIMINMRIENKMINLGEKELYKLLSTVDSNATKLAKQCHFISRIMTERELSGLILKIKTSIDAGDIKPAELLMSMYLPVMIDNAMVHHINNTYFVFHNEDLSKITAEQHDILYALTTRAELHNPVYVEIDADGSLIVD